MLHIFSVCQWWYVWVLHPAYHNLAWPGWCGLYKSYQSGQLEPADLSNRIGWGRSFPDSIFILILPMNLNFILILSCNVFILNPFMPRKRLLGGFLFYPDFFGHLEFYPLIQYNLIASVILTKILNFIQ